jgi:hypothetical protein
VGFRPWFRRAPTRRTEARIEFLGEQDGAMERRLKNALLPLLQQSNISRAYLVRVGFQPSETGFVALALAPASAKDLALVSRIGELFRTLAPADVFVDILFLTDPQEEDATRVCSPFYSRAN